MSYYIAVDRRNPDNPRWRVLFDWYEEGRKHVRSVPPDDWGPLGFIRSMTVEQARRHAEELNESDRGARIEAKRNKIRARLAEEDAIENHLLPPAAVAQFEHDILLKRFASGDPDIFKRNRYEFFWRAARRILHKLSLNPAEWSEERAQFYREFQRQAMSQSQVRKVSRMINAWGRFWSKRRGVYFEPLPPPNRHENKRLITEFRKRGERKDSAPLTPELLQEHRGDFTESEYNWLFITVWLGLRPEEADLMHDSRNFEIFRDPRANVDAIKVFMPKIVTTDGEDSWKKIAILDFEQRQAVSLITSGAPISRPRLAKIQRAFGKEFRAYAGRKGFYDLMLARGRTDHAISEWMGHLDFRTTKKHYANKRRVRVA